jgi:hypothetical protein
MPLTVKVGLTKEIGLPNGKLGVSCGVEVETDVASLRDVEGFNRTVQEAYSVCQHAVDGELHRHGEPVDGITLSSPRNGSACRCRSPLIGGDLLGRLGRQGNRPS